MIEVPIKKIETINVTHVMVELPVEFGDEDMPYDFPLRHKDQWKAKIEIDTGKIIDWPKGKVGEFYMKVCDSGSYTLYNEFGQEIVSRDDYVPHGLVPGDTGDYVDLKINENGIITNWPEKPYLNEFFEDIEI